MIKNSILAGLLMLTLVARADAHTLLLSAWDNEDGTMTVAGQFDTGATAQGAQVRLEALDGGTVLFAKRLPVESELIVDIPDRPYTIVLDGGPGHTVVRDGIAPPDGFAQAPAQDAKGAGTAAGKSRTQKAGSAPHSLNKAYLICTATAFLFMALTIVICRRNTNRLLAELKRAR